MKTFGFPKPEHLTLQRDIDALFAAGGHSAVAFPVRAVWRLAEWSGRGPRVKVLVSVSKRKFKHAVDRNRAKRQMREAYRLNKYILGFNQTEVESPSSTDCAATGAASGSSSAASGSLPSVPRCIAENAAPRQALHIGFIWVADKPQESRFVQKRVVNLLKRINEQIGKQGLPKDESAQ